jgi:Fe-S-cluster containining protein
MDDSATGVVTGPSNPTQMDAPASTPTPPSGSSMTSAEANEIERQLRHASFFVQASLEQQGKLTGKLDVFVTSLIELLLDRGVIDAEALAKAVDANRRSQADEQRARYDGNDGKMPAWPTVMVREDPAPAEAADGDGHGDGSANGNGQGSAPRQAPAAVEVEVDCDARMHICKAACCSLPFPLSADEVEAGKVKWDLGHPYVIRHSEAGYCVHNERSTGGCDVYDHRPGVCRGYSCAEDDRIWLDFDNMVLNEDFLGNRHRADFQFKPATAEAVPVTISPRTSRTSAGSEPAQPQQAPAPATPATVGAG